jgi:hypothetical protein
MGEFQASYMKGLQRQELRECDSSYVAAACKGQKILQRTV